MTFKSLVSNIVLAGAITAAVSAHAAAITVDFGSGAGVDGSLAAYTGTGSASNGTSLSLGTSLSIANGALTVTITGAGATQLYCVQGTTVGKCGTTTGLSTSPQTASGIGGGPNSGSGNSPSRVDHNEHLVFTVNPGYIVTLSQFSVDEFGTPEGGEGASYSVNGGAAIAFSPSASALDTFDPADFTFHTLDFTANSGTDYAFSSLQLDVTSTAVPEPGTLALMAAGLAGVVALRRRKLA